MRARIRKPIEPIERETAERCRILEIANDADDAHLSIARARVAPGVTTQWHLLRHTDERYIIVGGSGVMEGSNIKPTAVVAGDVVQIPADMAQRITNTGDVDLVFYCVCTPRFCPKCYQKLPHLESNV